MKVLILKNPRKFVKSAQINIYNGGVSIFVTTTHGDWYGACKSVHAAKVVFGIHYLAKGNKWEEKEL